MVVLVSLLFQWSNPIITRYSLYFICTFVTFYCSAYMLLIAGPAEMMIKELKTLGRYFCYFFPLLPLLFWLIIRERLSPETKLFPFLERVKRSVFGQSLDSRLVLTGIMLGLVFPSCFAYWGYGAALLAKIPVRQGTIVYQGDNLLRSELRDFPPDSMVMSSHFTAIQTFSPIKHVVQNPASRDEFLRNKNNHLLDALILFPKAMGAKTKMTELEKEQWTEELDKDIIVDDQGNQFVKTCSHQGEGAFDGHINRRTFVIYRRVGSPGFNFEIPQ